jgi:hypothetical protein
VAGPSPRRRDHKTQTRTFATKNEAGTRARSLQSRIDT